MSAPGASEFERCVSTGGIAVFPSDTVYGIACDAQDPVAVQRLYELKGRVPGKPAAVMFFDLELALAALPELGSRTRSALERLLPGAVMALLPNPALRFPLACAADKLTVGLRVPALAGLREVRSPVVQSSANLAGAPEARRLGEVPEPIRRSADVLIDGGTLLGTPSTIVDLRGYEKENAWRIVRRGAVAERDVAAALEQQFHFDPSG